MARKNSKTKVQQTGQAKKSSHLASNHATILSGLDTPVLQKDIAEEYQYGLSQGKLIADKWVRFFDWRSSELRKMYSILQNSVTLSRGIQDRVNLIMGDGFNAIDTGGGIPFLKSLKKMFKYATGQNTGEQDLNDLIASVNLNRESLEEVIRKVAYDYEAFGNAVVYINRVVKGGNTSYVIYHAPLETIAVHKADPKTNLIPSIGISKNWDIQGLGAGVTEIPLFPEFSKEGNGGKTAIHIKNYAPNFFYYGLPNWYPARFWAELEYFIPKYNIDKFLNGFLPSVFIELYGNVSKEQAQQMTKDIVDTFTGVGNGSKIFTQFLQSKEHAANITPLADNSEGKFLDLQKMTTQNIVTAVGTTMSLSGVAQGGKLGTNQQIRDELDLITNTSIKSTRGVILRKIVNVYIGLVKENNQQIESLVLDIANSNPISLASSIDVNNVLSRNERRDILGYAPDEEQVQEGEPNNQ